MYTDVVPCLYSLLEFQATFQHILIVSAMAQSKGDGLSVSKAMAFNMVEADNWSRVVNSKGSMFLSLIRSSFQEERYPSLLQDPLKLLQVERCERSWEHILRPHYTGGIILGQTINYCRSKSILIPLLYTNRPTKYICIL